ncbi:enoyl-CoA hydratase/isomerase family protein [Tropicimonas isoalkanivorans]|uniref:Enoyl-CoA hydratase n=1 Tax=Tropicimonas isoalkanivorans TaxID=441112 RepID=A0A1I1I3M6_9RHOB|nr:enoyl-CoA hydratase/isomerase family protein [Tropicimonas isoalkanivorans]SFC27820.1 enoyl-CoA hydratase [Tropicimonas isoalkanivorans]
MQRYARYQRLKFDMAADRVLRVTMSNPGKLNAADQTMHAELGEVWRDVDADPDINAVILTGEGEAFSAGGEMSMIHGIMDDFEIRARNWKEARAIVMNVIDCNKPIVSAIRGPAVGAGLVCGMLADVSIVSKTAKIIDGHTKLGVAAGDHAAIIWPMLCGMAKAKYYLLTCDTLTGEEAERIGLVSMCVEDDALEETALKAATKLANMAPSAIRWTKHSLNNWLRQAGPIFDASLALEFLGFTGPEVREGVAGFTEKRKPQFPPTSPV